MRGGHSGHEQGTETALLCFLSTHHVPYLLHALWNFHSSHTRAYHSEKTEIRYVTVIMVDYSSKSIHFPPLG